MKTKTTKPPKRAKSYKIVWHRAPHDANEIGPVVQTEIVTGTKKRATEYAKKIAAERSWYFKWIEPVTPEADVPTNP